jgi:hypothetical protein
MSHLLLLRGMSLARLAKGAALQEPFIHVECEAEIQARNDFLEWHGMRRASECNPYDPDSLDYVIYHNAWQREYLALRQARIALWFEAGIAGGD